MKLTRDDINDATYSAVNPKTGKTDPGRRHVLWEKHGKAKKPDGAVPGFGLRVYPSGKKSYVYKFELNGKDEWGTLGAEGELTLDDARAKAKDWAHQVSLGNDPRPKSTRDLQEPTFRDIFIAYAEKLVQGNCKTVAVIEKDFERWFGGQSGLANKKASSITDQDVENLKAKLMKVRPAPARKNGDESKRQLGSPYSANRAIQLGRAIYNGQKLYKGANPFAEVELNKERARKRFLSDEEAAKILRFIKEPTADGYERDLRDFIWLDMWTGARKSNMLAMEWSELDLEKAHTWTIPPEKSKGDEEQIIPLGQTEIDVLKERQTYLQALQAKSGRISPIVFVFPGTGKTGHLTDLKRSWSTLRTKLKIEDVHIHDLRRSLGSTMASLNVNVSLIQSALKHQDPKTTMKHYAHANRPAELVAKQLAHSAWLEAERNLVEEPKELETVVPFKKRKTK